MIRNIIVCNNCGKQGHLFHQCKLPITSYGMVVFKTTQEGIIQYLMIRRKDSFGYIDFIRGKYSPYNIPQLLITINEMSIEEKERILTMTFDDLWADMWGERSINSQFRNEELASKKKFELLKEGIIVNDKIIDLEIIVKMSETCWDETEWEFPKGRRNQKEKDLDCALREFEEETGISKNELNVIENILPFEELFIGSNHKSYKHKYFLAMFDETGKTDDYLTKYQRGEVSKLEWKTIDECLESIRPYNLEKKILITNINNVLQEYRLYS